MSTAAAPPSSLATSSITASRAVRAWATAVIGALALNLLALAIGAAAGANMLVTPPGAVASSTVGVGSVVLTTAGSTILALVALVVARRWGARGWRTTAWLGLALGIITIVLPLSVQASAGTKLTLASMHLLTGLAWFVAVRRSLTSKAVPS